MVDPYRVTKVRERYIYMARVDGTVLVYCPERLRKIAHGVLRSTPADEVFTVQTCEHIAGTSVVEIRGPAWHGFVDDEHFVPAAGPMGERLVSDDVRLAELRRICGEEEWAEGGFVFDEGLLYGVVGDAGQLVAAGNMTPFRGSPADVGLITHPDHRGRGLAKAIASRMTGDALPEARIVRYRTRTANTASLAVARSLGFVGRGENLVARLRQE